MLRSAVDDACSCLSLLVQRKTLGGGEYRGSIAIRGPP